METRKAAAQVGAYAAMALAAVLGVVLLSVSYGRNRAFIAQTAANIAALQQVPAVPATAPRKRLSRASMPYMPLWLRPTIIAPTRRG